MLVHAYNLSTKETKARGPEIPKTSPDYILGSKPDRDRRIALSLKPDWATQRFRVAQY